jgi:hypothetical protein
MRGKDMDESQFLISPQEILKAVERRRPRTRLTELAALVGEEGAAAIMMAFTGDSIHFPVMGSINRIMQEEYVRKELKGLHKDKNGYDEKVDHLAKLFGVTRDTILVMRKR